VATVALADLPAFLADQASSLTSAAGQDAAASAPTSASAATTTAPRTAQAVKELQISLDPADLGEMTVKLRLANGKLSVSISVANPTTLGAIEDDRNLIAARLSDGDQTLEDLVISRQAPSTEVSSTNASQDASQDGGAAEDGESAPGAQNPRAGARRASGGGFSDLLV
jgi:chemotaxis protein MotD